MKFCYADDSRDGQGQLLQVMVGIIADAQRLNRSRLEFGEIFNFVDDIFPEGLRELKGSRIFYGHGGWRRVEPEIRKEIFHQFCGWLDERKHQLALSAIDIARFGKELPTDYPDELKDLWLAGAVHIALQLQRLLQSIKKNKGHTVLIFDEQPVRLRFPARRGTH